MEHSKTQGRGKTLAMAQPKLSVIIPALNEAEFIGKLLRDLSRQRASIPFEVVVVDSCSEDDTAETARQFAKQLDLTVISLDKRGAARARNAGAKQANADYLVFLDADIRLPKEFISTFWQEHENYNADMMTTRFTSTGLHPFDLTLYRGISRFFEKSFTTKHPLMSGCVQFVSKDIHQKVKGYRETKRVGEDVDYSQRIAKHANHPRFVKKIRVKASNRRFKKDGRITMLLRQYQWASGKTLGRAKVDAFEFGHYQHGKRKLTWLDVMKDRSLLTDVLHAVWYMQTS